MEDVRLFHTDDGMIFGNATSLLGISGAQYEFNIFPRATRFQANAGIYVMGRQAAGRKFEFCFISHTDDLSKRPFNPDKATCFREFGVDHIFVMEEPDARQRAQIVDDLIKSYAPFCNLP